MKTLKSVLLLALVFATGIVVGVVATRIVVRRMVEQAILEPGQVQRLAEMRLTRRLGLTADQQAKLHEIFAGMRGHLKDLRSEYQPQASKILNNANDQINAMLTPAQRAEYEEWKQEEHPLVQAIKHQ